MRAIAFASRLLAGTLVVLSFPAQATQTGGVFGPTVNEGHRSFQYRIAFDPDTDGVAQRLHYQQASNGNAMWRVIAQSRKTAARDVDFDFVQGELFWQLPNVRGDWRQGLRFDLRYRDDDRPNQVGINYMHDFRIAERWRGRALLLTARQFGDNRASGVFLGTRYAAYYSLDDRQTLGVEMYAAHGKFSDIQDFEDQSYQLGPTYSLRFGGGWSLFAGYLGGLTSGSPDHSLRIWLTRSL